MDWHSRLPCLSPTPGACSNSCPLSRWCHPTISSSVAPFSSCLQSFPASGSFPMSQLFAPGGQSIGASASVSVLLKTIQSWFPLGLTGLISLQSKEPKVSLFLGLFQELSIIYFLLMQVCDMPVPCLHFFFHVDPKSFLKQRNKVKTETLPQVGGSRNLTEV